MGHSTADATTHSREVSEMENIEYCTGTGSGVFLTPLWAHSVQLVAEK